jgi:hypothetical protein
MSSLATVRRIKGSLQPPTDVYWREDGVFLDLSAYTPWTLECIDVSGAVAFVDKTTGIVSAAGDDDTPNVVITWETADLGALSAGRYRCELTGTLSAKPRKGQFWLLIEDEVV